MTLPLTFSFQSLLMNTAATVAANRNVTGGNAAIEGEAPSSFCWAEGATRAPIIDWDNEPTNPMIQVSDLSEKTIVESRSLPYEVAHEMLTYDAFGITTDELSRFERWLGTKHIRVGFFTKGIELLVQMRREQRSLDEEITQVMPVAARRRI